MGALGLGSRMWKGVELGCWGDERLWAKGRRPGPG